MKKKSVSVIFALVAIMLTSIAPVAYGQGKGKAKSKGPESEIIIDVFGDPATPSSIPKTVIITNDKGKTVFSDTVKGAPVNNNWTGTITIPITNGKYTVSCRGGIADKTVNVDLNYNRVTIEASYYGSTKIKLVSKSIISGSAVVAKKIETTVPKVFTDINAALAAKLPPSATIAIFPVSATSADYGEMVLENLTKQFVNSNKYTVVEKRRVEELLAEYDFQNSGMVGEKTLGELLGADAVIFSKLTDEGNLYAWAVDTSERTTLAQSLLAQAQIRKVEYPPVPIRTIDKDNPDKYTMTVEEYRTLLLLPWASKILSIAKANPLAPFAREPLDYMFRPESSIRYGGGSFDSACWNEAHDAWEAALRQLYGMDTRKTLTVLPISGGSNNEGATINSFLLNYISSISGGFLVSDQSANAELAKHAGNFFKYTDRQQWEFRELLRRSDVDAVVSGEIQQIGRKNTLILCSFDSEGRLSLMFLEYADALELWVKLQYIPPVSHSTATRTAHIWSQFGAGVNRAEAETLTQLLIADTLSIPYESAKLNSFLDYTRDYEEALPAMPQRTRVEGIVINNPGKYAPQWREYVKTPQFSAGTDNQDARYSYYALRSLAKISDVNQPFFFDWSRRGNRTRLDVGYAYRGIDDRRLYFRYSIEYGSGQEFLAKMRGLSLFILTKAASPDDQILGLDGYDLSTAVAPAPVPANFFKLNRVSSQTGAAPMGGFYFAEAPVTQREFESVMNKNPSAVKNPARPVTNVSMVDAMIFCNQLSIRDGLEPAYLIEYVDRSREKNNSGVFRYTDGGIKTVNIDSFANGYRLPTAEEWQYAYKQMSARKEGINTAASEYVFNGAIAYLPDENKFETVRIPRHEETFAGVSPGIRLVRPVFDYWKYTNGK